MISSNISSKSSYLCTMFIVSSDSCHYNTKLLNLMFIKYSTFLGFKLNLGLLCMMDCMLKLRSTLDELTVIVRSLINTLLRTGKYFPKCSHHDIDVRPSFILHVNSLYTYNVSLSFHWWSSDIIR